MLKALAATGAPAAQFVPAIALLTGAAAAPAGASSAALVVAPAAVQPVQVVRAHIVPTVPSTPAFTIEALGVASTAPRASAILVAY